MFNRDPESRLGFQTYPMNETNYFFTFPLGSIQDVKMIYPKIGHPTKDLLYTAVQHTERTLLHWPRSRLKNATPRRRTLRTRRRRLGNRDDDREIKRV